MSAKIDIGPQGFIYPMPMNLVGADLESGPNFMPIAWINRAAMNPPLLMCALNRAHATNAGIREHGEFSVNIPDVDQIAVTDWCGLGSAKRGADKAGVFTVERRTLAHAPLIAECPLSLECRVVQVVDIGTHELFVAEVVATWTEERFLDAAGKPDVTKLRPFMLTMPDNRYWAVGEQVGSAWSDGRAFTPPEA
jgi:flavin reductase (DIM6/NTAB) family NADH-FMN oxidoreductase RutF